MVSVLIPARNEQYLGKTIENVLENARDEIEIIVILDGYIPDPQLHFDNRVIFVHYKESIGQRQAINIAARMAKGKYIMKLDAHCAVDEGFDVKLATDCEEDMTMIGRMYNLDIETWKPKLHKFTDYMYFSSPNFEKPFRSQYYYGDEFRRLHRKKELIDDILCIMGPCFFMWRDRFFMQGGCDEGHGSWGNQGIEVSLKAWLSGGRLVVNKKTWFAHWFRGGGGPGFPYHITGNEQERARAYSRNLWLNNKWPGQVRPLSWLLDKFKPVPTWHDSLGADSLAKVEAAGLIFNKAMNSKDKLVFDTETKSLDNPNPSPVSAPSCSINMEEINEFNQPIWNASANMTSNNNIYRNIRRRFQVLTRDDFSPIGAHEGDRTTLIEVWKDAGYKEGVEIGVKQARYSEKILSTIPDCKLHCIDPWDVYKESHLSRVTQDNNYSKVLQRLDPYIKEGRAVIVKDYSQNVASNFKDGSLDFLFIDGMHTFDGCALDLILWCPKVRIGGMICVHDYLAMRRGGVMEAVNAYTKCHMIHPWFVTREVLPTAFWIVEK